MQMEPKIGPGLGRLLAEHKTEQGIAAFRAFYMTHLAKVRNPRLALQELSEVNQQFAAKNPAGYLFIDRKYHDLIDLGEAVLKKHFPPGLVELYKKSFPDAAFREKDLSKDSHWLLTLLGILTGAMENLKEAHQQSFNYRKNLVAYTYNCLYCNGLHPDILKRDPALHKRFNLQVEHYYRSRKPVMEYKILMTYDDFFSQFLKLYLQQKPIKFGGKLIPPGKIHEVKITTTLLKDEEIPVFALKNKFSWSEEGKNIPAFISLCQDETETYHPNPFDQSTYSKEINHMLMMQARQFLTSFPDSKKLYDKAISNYGNKLFERNVLDDLRLSLELLLRHILGNNKSLENQLDVVGKLYKQKGASQEVLNMFQKILDYYSKYQNNYVKHDDNVNSDEIEFVINLTTTFMLFFIKSASS
jgi:hypothetical protein